MITSPVSTLTLPESAERYRVSVEEYRTFRRHGFLTVPGLVASEEIEALRQHTEDLMQGRLPEQQAVMAARDPSKDTGVTGQRLEAPPPHLSPEEKAQYFLRIHMLHRKLALHERYMLQPRVLDVLEALIGPDVLALQTMLFLKPPGKPGQGWHQDRFYIPTHPDTLIGAWIAIDDCDEENGAMWMALGSHVEPIYPPREGQQFGHRELRDIRHIAGFSDPDDTRNELSPIADRYPQVLVPARAGDVVFFHGHVLHRSKRNFSADRFRRAFVSHYCNARSFTQWGVDRREPGDPMADRCLDPTTGMTNGSHILARGDTHLPYALPRFGTPCAALLSPEERRREREFAAAAMADRAGQMMEMAAADPEVKERH